MSDLFAYFSQNSNVGSEQNETKGTQSVTNKDVPSRSDTKEISFNKSSSGATQKEEKNSSGEDQKVIDTPAESALVKQNNDKGKIQPTDKKDPEFNLATFIRYNGESISITKFVSPDELSKVTLESLRKVLEKYYPELTKQRCAMDFDKKKNLIVPIVRLGSKGAFVHDGIRGYFTNHQDLFNHMQPVNFLAAADGIYEVKKNTIGLFVARTDITPNDSNILKLMRLANHEELKQCEEGFMLLLPRIPQNLLLQLVSFFMDFTYHADVEVMGVFYWDLEKRVYLLDIPYQRVSKVSVDAKYTDLELHMIKVAEVHSHNQMPSYFSGVDNRDELATILYGVIGRMKTDDDQIYFNLKCRAGLAGKFINLQPSVIVEGDFPLQNVSDHMKPDSGRPFKQKYVPYPQEWLEKVIIDKRRGLVNA
ncbi:hypothetical protein ABE82_26025 (plasmid) [Paenibacillus peoriae]|uniref:hypothetical protein n=1 Tax=Paenibacillus peoriae TaxID=59893 RepID=UPI00071FF8BF|nr:hypothetical protein [Paenibacillus peoriae]ALS09879.1 hypothetical protein ABE82_26025 [Paenibacillus peoriae]